MSFKQCLALPNKYLYLKSTIDNVTGEIALTYPARKVYSRASLTELILRKAPLGVDANQLIDVLCDINVITKRVHTTCSRCAFDEILCTCEAPNLKRDTRYEVTGEMVALINALTVTIPSGWPYFISYRSLESTTEAILLKESLGPQGFLSATDLITGDQWRRQIGAGLRSCKTFFMVETHQYHSSNICAIERDYAVAAGYRIVRIGLDSHDRLVDCPGWLDDHIQYSSYIVNGKFDIARLMAMDALPNPLSITVRKEGGRALIDRLDETAIMDLADKIGAGDKISVNTNKKQKGIDLLQLAFKDPVTADLFCRRFDFAQIGL